MVRESLLQKHFWSGGETENTYTRNVPEQALQHPPSLLMDLSSYFDIKLRRVAGDDIIIINDCDFPLQL